MSSSAVEPQMRRTTDRVQFNSNQIHIACNSLSLSMFSLHGMKNRIENNEFALERLLWFKVLILLKVSVFFSWNENSIKNSAIFAFLTGFSVAMF